MTLNEIIRRNKLWSQSEAIKSPDTIYRQLKENTKFLESIQKRGTIMERILAFILMILTPVLIISIAEASSVSLSNDAIYYKGYNISGNSLSFNTDYGKYGYQVSVQQTDSYQLNQENGDLTINNKVDISSILLGLYRKIKFGNFYIKPMIGAVHSTVNVETKILYQKDFKLFNDIYPVSLQYEIYNSKTGILLVYGLYLGYSISDTLHIFYGIKEQGYRLSSTGIEINF